MDCEKHENIIIYGIMILSTSTN